MKLDAFTSAMPAAFASGQRPAGRLPAQNVFAVEPVLQQYLRANGHTDGLERALGSTQHVRFDVAVFLCHRNDRFAIRGVLELPVAVRVALTTARDPLLEHPLR